MIGASPRGMDLSLSVWRRAD